MESSTFIHGQVNSQTPVVKRIEQSNKPENIEYTPSDVESSDTEFEVESNDLDIELEEENNLKTSLFGICKDVK